MTGPLAGIRVLDLSRLLPGPFCSMLLADYGADVLKVEDTAAGDYMRWAPPRYDGVEPSAASAFFLALNRGKRSIRLNLKHEQGREVLLRLAREYDVLLESFRPGVLDRLGVGYERLRQENRGLVYCAITGYGQTGPDRDRPGHDLNYLARGGLLGLNGPRGGPPVPPAVQIADLGGGAMMAAFGILAALHERTRTGEGQLVDVSMTRGAQSWLVMVAAGFFADGFVPRRGELDLAGGLPCYRPYPCADGWVALAALEPKFWEALCAGLGRDDLRERQMDPTVAAELEAIFAARTRAQWAAFEAEHNCCVEPVLELDEALARSPEAIVQMDQPGAAAPVRVLGPPVGFSRTPGDGTRPAPPLGADTDAVLAELGYGADAVAALKAGGAVAGPGGPAGTSFLG
ncbi:MAG TPA: CaiB/BaiF CoA-transferase family protein [Gemmatimonadales bacterium]